MYLTRNQIARLAGISYNVLSHYMQHYPINSVEAPNMRKTQKYYLRSDVEAWIKENPITLKSHKIISTPNLGFNTVITRLGISKLCGKSYEMVTRWLEKYPLEPVPNRNLKQKFYRLADVELWLQQLTTKHQVNLAKSKPYSY